MFISCNNARSTALSCQKLIQLHSHRPFCMERSCWCSHTAFVVFPILSIWRPILRNLILNPHLLPSPQQSPLSGSLLSFLLLSLKFPSLWSIGRVPSLLLNSTVSRRNSLWVFNSEQFSLSVTDFRGPCQICSLHRWPIHVSNESSLQRVLSFTLHLVTHYMPVGNGLAIYPMTGRFWHGERNFDGLCRCVRVE